MISIDQSYEKIYAENYQSVYSFLHRLTRDKADAEQLTKNTFLKGFNLLLHYNGHCSLRTWLLSVAANLYPDYLRKVTRSLDVRLFVADPEADLNESPFFQWEHYANTGDLYRYLTELPRNNRVILLLRVFGEVSYEELSKLLNITPESVAALFIRTKENIKEELFHD